MSGDRLVLLSTHIVSDIEYIANEVLMMKEGRVFFSGTQEEVLRSVPVRAWSCQTGRGEVEAWQKQFLLSNVKTCADGAQLRVLAKSSPCPGAVEEEMTLEDAFLYYFGEKGEHEDDVL